MLRYFETSVLTCTFFRKCDNLNMSHLHGKFHKPTVSPFFINTHRTPTESYMRITKSFFLSLEKDEVNTQSAIYVLNSFPLEWFLSFWCGFAYYCSYSNVHCIMSINTNATLSKIDFVYAVHFIQTINFDLAPLYQVSCSDMIG